MMRVPKGTLLVRGPTPVNDFCDYKINHLVATYAIVYNLRHYQWGLQNLHDRLRPRTPELHLI